MIPEPVAVVNDTEQRNPGNHSGTADAPITNLKTEGALGEKLILPKFSSGVKNALSEGNSSKVWSQMIDELLTFYSRKYPKQLSNCWLLDVFCIPFNCSIWNT